MENNKYQQVIAESKVVTDDAKVKAEVEALLAAHLAENDNKDVYKMMFNCIDLTTLGTDDSERSVAAFTQKVNDFESNYAEYPNVAAICVYSKFAEVVRENLEASDVNIAVCSANFPSSQARLEVKTVETALAVADGANEVDIVFPVSYFMDGAYEEIADEIAEIKQSARHDDVEAHLKVILETGLLKTAENIKIASILSMYSGADFIKTSTGKGYPGATPEAVYTMCRVIREYAELNEKKVGIKVAGGVRSAKEAVRYYTIVKDVLGDEWLNKSLFRIGASSLVEDLEKQLTSFDE